MHSWLEGVVLKLVLSEKGENGWFAVRGGAETQARENQGMREGRIANMEKKMEMRVVAEEKKEVRDKMVRLWKKTKSKNVWRD